MMKVSSRGVLEIAEHEGVVLGPYLDSVGVWTYGVGHTAAAGGPNPSKMNKVDTRSWSSAQVEAEVKKALGLFKTDLLSYEKRVNRVIPNDLKQHQFDALVSWDFNTGGATWKSKTGQPCQLVKELRNGDFSGNGFMGWVKPKEIVKRRKAEQNLFRTGNYDANGRSIPVWDVTKEGKVKFRSILDESLISHLFEPTKPTVTPKQSWMDILLGLAKRIFKKP